MQILRSFICQKISDDQIDTSNKEDNKEDRLDFNSTIIDHRNTQRLGRRNARGVTHLDDALYLWV